MSLQQSLQLTQKVFDENMYLVQQQELRLEETGGANFIFVTKG